MKQLLKLMFEKVLSTGLKRSMLFVFRIAVYSVVVLSFFVLTTVSLAQQDPRNCAEIQKDDYDSKGDWVNARIDCRNENFNKKISDFVEISTDPSLDILTDKQKEHLKNERDRSEKARKNAKEAGSFKTLTKKQNPSCLTKEWEEGNGDEDGICQKGEDCEEVVGDQIGDDEQPCKTTGPKKDREVCVQICDMDATASIDENFDDEDLDKTEQNLIDATEMMEENTTAMKKRVMLMKTTQVLRDLYRLSNSEEDECVNILYPSDLPNPIHRFDFTNMQGVLAGANVAEWAHATCDSVCNQDSFGWNCSAACFGLAIAAGILDTVYEALELQDDTVTGMRLDESIKCLEQLSGKLGNTEQLIIALKTQVKEGFEDVLYNLKLPPGSRPGFGECRENGKCTGNESIFSCPNDCCGNKCYEDCVCNSPCETAETCPNDCTVCGNCLCDGPCETAETCPNDCFTCGDGTCGPCENTEDCPEDCCVSHCDNNGTCDPYCENEVDCPADCSY